MQSKYDILSIRKSKCKTYFSTISSKEVGLYQSDLIKLFLCLPVRMVASIMRLPLKKEGITETVSLVLPKEQVNCIRILLFNKDTYNWADLEAASEILSLLKGRTEWK